MNEYNVDEDTASDLFHVSKVSSVNLALTDVLAVLYQQCAHLARIADRRTTPHENTTSTSERIPVKL